MSMNALKMFLYGDKKGDVYLCLCLAYKFHLSSVNGRQKQDNFGKSTILEMKKRFFPAVHTCCSRRSTLFERERHKLNGVANFERAGGGSRRFEKRKVKISTTITNHETGMSSLHSKYRKESCIERPMKNKQSFEFPDSPTRLSTVPTNPIHCNVRRNGSQGPIERSSIPIAFGKCVPLHRE
jgi:hypothetical protein